MKRIILTREHFTFIVCLGLLLSSCNLLNNEINNINKKSGDTVSDISKLTITGNVSNFGGEFDEMRVYDDINFKYKKILGTCYILNNGNFTLNLQAKVDISHTIGSDNIGWALFPPPQTAEDRKVMTTGFSKIYAYKNGVLVGSIVKSVQKSQLSSDNDYSESDFPYSTQGYNNLTYTWTDSNGTQMSAIFTLKKGWSEIVTHLKFNYSTNKSSGFVSDTVPTGMQWVFSSDTIMYRNKIYR